MNSRAAAASNRAERETETEYDAKLIHRAKQDDRRAFRELVERHQRRAFAVALAFVRDEQDASEIVQEAFVRVFKNLSAFSGSSSFFTWLYRIVKNLSIDSLRRPFRRECELEISEDPENWDPIFSAEAEPDPSAWLGRRELAECIGRALDALPAYHRGVIVMREVEGMSYEEMAESMGVSQGTIMSRLYHARRKLQRALRECYRETVGREPAIEDTGA